MYPHYAIFEHNLRAKYRTPVPPRAQAYSHLLFNSSTALSRHYLRCRVRIHLRPSMSANFHSSHTAVYAPQYNICDHAATMSIEREGRLHV